MFANIKQVPSDFFNKVTFDSGVLVKAGGSYWDKTDPFTITDSMIITATSGDFTVASEPNIINLFDDVNGVPNGTKEGTYVESWEHTIGVTAINTSVDVIKLALGCADVDGNKITPRLGLAQSADFTSIAWIAQTVDGGLMFAELTNAMSTDGLSITTGKNTKGNFPLTIKGFYSIASPDTSPVNYYVVAPRFTVTFNSNGGSAVTAQTVEQGGKATEPSPAPTKASKTFGGWYKEAALTNAWNFSTDTVSADITLYAKWA